MSDSQPLVSIIIPCYNDAATVAEAIESALGQTYPCVEVIVIDDGSTDESLDVVRAFEGRIRWETGPNRGACAARNRGLELARGELVQFLDADDLLHAEKLERQVPVLLESEIDLVYCHGAIKHADRNKNTTFKRSYRGEDVVVFMLEDKLQTLSALHRKEKVREVGGFTEDLPCAQERDLHIRLACYGARIAELPEILYTNRQYSSGLSDDYIRVLDQHKDIALNAARILAEKDKLTESRREALAGFLAVDARMYLQRGEKEKAADYFRQARQLHPEGGLSKAFNSPPRYAACRLLGLQLAEKLIGFSERIRA